MKRSREERPYSDKVDYEPSSSSGGPAQQPSLPLKRAKSTQACSSCRKHKTRCEQTDGSSSVPQRCHRCKVLNMSCSFDNSNVSHTTISAFKESPTISTRILPEPEDTHQSISPRPMQPEDLVAAPATPWGVDWTATPMLAIQDLARRPNPRDASFVDHCDTSIAEIISADQMRFLLDIFASGYSPWLNLPPSSDDRAPLLDLVRCTVASRHLDTVTRSIVAPRLQRMTDEAIFKRMFSPIPSTDAIQALIILALWSPVSGTPQTEARDSRLLIASAVSMAMNLRLSQASVHATRLQEQKARENGLSAQNSLELAKAMEKARLWICLANTESMLCAGTGREPLSHCSSSDTNVITSSFLTVDTGREMRLGLMAQLFDATERGFQIRLSSSSDVEKWQKEITQVLIKMDSLHRDLSPLPVVAEHDIYFFHMLLVYYNFCRLLILHQALLEARRVLPGNATGKPWYRQLSQQVIHSVSSWGQEAILAAESVLVTSLSRQENIGTAPDNLFAMIAFAAIWLMMAKFAMFQTQTERNPVVSNGLLVKTVERLAQSTLAPDHIPAKCAQFIAASLKTLETRTVRLGLNEEVREDMETSQPVFTERTPVQFAMPEPAMPFVEKQHPTEMPNLGFHYDLKALMDSNPDSLLDADFWPSFMNNLSTGHV